MRKWMTFALVVLFLLGTTSLAVWAQEVGVAQVGGQAGTTLVAEKTATGFWEKHITYDWTLAKSVSATEVDICSGETHSLQYCLTATRTKVGEQDVYGVRGTICVTNGGAVATENLKLADQVEYKMPGPGQYEPLAGASQTIFPVQLAPGETSCFDYEIAFAPVQGALYRNTVKVTITNHSGHMGEEFGPEPKADFSLPDEPKIIETDESATVSDAAICPEGFSCIPDSGGPWTFTGSGQVCFGTAVRNVSALCDSYSTLSNTATLVEGDSETQRTATASVTIYTCPCGGGCTLTIGYWKTHAGFTGRNADRVSQHLPIWLGTAGGAESVQVMSAEQAVLILSMGLGDPSNGITKLYAQLLAAKLNIANGADGTAAAATIAATDGFLAQKDWTDWASLSKAMQKQVLAWMTILDQFNNGYIGPGHCS